MNKKIHMTLIVLLILLSLTGCINSKAASSKTNPSKNEVINLIAYDLQFHKIDGKTLTINKITTNRTGTTAVVEYTVTMNDGSKKVGKSNLIKDDGVWEIEGHRH